MDSGGPIRLAGSPHDDADADEQNTRVCRHLSIFDPGWSYPMSSVTKRRYKAADRWQWYSIGSDNGLVPNRRQAIIWTNDGLGWWRIYASFNLNELIEPFAYWQLNP